MSVLSCNHCSATFPEAADGIVLLGRSDEEKKLAQYTAIEQHQSLMHPEIHIAAALLVGKLKWLTVMAHVSEMDSTSPGQAFELFKKRRQIAAEIAHATGRVVTDEDLKTALNAWEDARDIEAGRIPPAGVPPWTGEARKSYNRGEVFRLLQNLRDQMSYKDVLRDAPEPALNNT